MSATDRSAPRVRTFLRGRIEFNDGGSSLDCLVRDFSEHGARLEISEGAALPLVFRLYVPHHERRYHAHLRWHRNGQAGVEFVSVKEPPSVNRGDADRIERLEAEIVRMRRLLESIRADPSRARLLLEQAG